MQNQSFNAGVIQYNNASGSDISSGDVIDLVHRAGVALVDIDNGSSGSVAVAGIYYLAKDSSTIGQTDEVYWSVSGSQATTSPAAGDPRLGIAARAAATGDSYVHVEINAPRTVGDVSVASGAGDAAANAAAIIALIGELEQAGILKKA